MSRSRAVIALIAAITLSAPVRAQRGGVQDPLSSIPKPADVLGKSTSEIADLLNRYNADQGSISRRYDAPDSPNQRKRMREFYSGWRTRLKEVDFEKLKQEGRVDYVLLDNLLKYQIALLDRADKQRAEQASLMPFADELLKLQDDRREMKVVNGQQAARVLANLAKQVDSLRLLIEQPTRGGADIPSAPRPPRAVANRAADEIDRIRNVVNQWYSYYQGYDPMFTWWVENPMSKIDESLNSYARTIRQRIVGIPVAGGAVAGGGGRAAGGRAGGAGGGGRNGG